MCRIDERVYVRPDGHESVFQDTTLCERGRRRNKTCSDSKKHRTEYLDPTSSPVTSSPLTPTFNTRTRRPSVSSRPSTRDGSITSLAPEIHIEFSSKKGKGKGYGPTVSITTGKSKRTSTGSTSGSEHSHAIRTGYPDTSPPPPESIRGGLRPQRGGQRLPSPDESFSSSSRVPSLYQTSDEYDSPSLVTTTTDASSNNRPIIHNGARHAPSPVHTTRGQTGSPASPYRTTEFKPSSAFDDIPARTERDHRHSLSYAPEITGRDEDRRRRRDEQRRREALDIEVAAAVMQEENQKHVRFSTDHPAHRNEERAQTNFAAREQRRDKDRERLHQQNKEQERAAREAAAKEAAAKRSKPSANHTKTRRGSVQMTSAQAAEQQRLVAAEAYQMEQERLKAEAIDLEEQRLQQPILQPRQPPSLQERQQDPGYYDPRGERVTQPSGQTPIIRRPSQSGQPRPDLGRRNSTRDSAAPQIRQDRRQPPVAFYNTVPVRPNLPAVRERRPSSSHGASPFAQPAAPADPWDHRTMSQALPGHGLPPARGPQVGHNFPQPQQATQRLNQAFNNAVFESDDDDDEKYRRRR